MTKLSGKINFESPIEASGSGGLVTGLPLVTDQSFIDVFTMQNGNNQPVEFTKTTPGADTPSIRENKDNTSIPDQIKTAKPSTQSRVSLHQYREEFQGTKVIIAGKQDLPGGLTKNESIEMRDRDRNVNEALDNRREVVGQLSKKQNIDSKKSTVDSSELLINKDQVRQKSSRQNIKPFIISHRDHNGIATGVKGELSTKSNINVERSGLSEHRLLNSLKSIPHNIDNQLNKNDLGMKPFTDTAELIKTKTVNLGMVKIPESNERTNKPLHVLETIPKNISQDKESLPREVKTQLAHGSGSGEKTATSRSVPKVMDFIKTPIEKYDFREHPFQNIKSIQNIVPPLSALQSINVNKAPGSTFYPTGTSFHAMIQKITHIIFQSANARIAHSTAAINGGSLGRLTIQFVQSQVSNKVTIVVETEAARTAIQKFLPQINENLMGKGIELSSLDVQINRSDQHNLPRKERPNNSKKISPVQSIDEPEENDPILIVRDYGYNTIEVLA